MSISNIDLKWALFSASQRLGYWASHYTLCVQQRNNSISVAGTQLKHLSNIGKPPTPQGLSSANKGFILYSF